MASKTRRSFQGMVPQIILMLITLALSGCNLQRNMLYYPSPYLPSQEQLAAERLEFWPSGPGDYRGFAAAAASSAPAGTIVVFHGNAGTASDRAYYVKALAPLGFRVILAEYPGYGRRSGQPGEKVFVQDAKETIRMVSEKFGDPVYLLGESLGCGVAAAAVKDSSVRTAGIILITPWDTLLAVAQKKFPWFPVRLFLTDTYDTVENLRSYPGRIAIVAAERDEVIPVEHARSLFGALPGDRKMWTVKNAGHNDWPGRVDRTWWNEIAGFIMNGR